MRVSIAHNFVYCRRIGFEIVSHYSKMFSQYDLRRRSSLVTITTFHDDYCEIRQRNTACGKGGMRGTPRHPSRWPQPNNPLQQCHILQSAFTFVIPDQSDSAGQSERLLLSSIVNIVDIFSPTVWMSIVSLSVMFFVYTGLMALMGGTGLSLWNWMSHFFMQVKTD